MCEESSGPGQTQVTVASMGLSFLTCTMGAAVRLFRLLGDQIRLHACTCLYMPLLTTVILGRELGAWGTADTPSSPCSTGTPGDRW